MPSKKHIYRKPYEHVERYEESVWMGNDTPILETDFTVVFNDRYPCVEGHKLFVPKENNSHFIGRAYGMAYDYGNQKVASGEIDGFNIGMNMGICAGQTIMWPHVHFIPRHKGDSKNPGGIRHAHTGVTHRRHY